MKAQKKDDQRELLPLDMVTVILTKLPAKSLFKFRCVSKQWCSIISSRPFINSFMSVSVSRPPRILLGYGIERRMIFFSLPLHPQDISNPSSLVSKYNVPFSNNNTGLCNSVRGLICFSNDSDNSVICNPTTKQVIAIPNDLTEFDPKKSLSTSMYLGYDTSNDQYKIMRTICWLPKTRDLEHSVCTLRLGEPTSFSSWRRVESGNGDYCIKTAAVCINGVVYYGGARPNGSLVIVSFDVGSERLLLMEAPKDNDCANPINYQGKLGCFCFTTIGNRFSLWILDDAKKQIWSKTGVFPPLFVDSYRKLKLRIYGTTTDAGEIIFVSGLFSGELFYYDLKKDKVSKSVRIGDIVRDDELSIDMRIASSCDHVENIISL